MQTANLKEKYSKETRVSLKKSLGKKNIYEVPALTKIVINTSFGKLSPDQKTREQISNNLAKIAGQKPLFTSAKKAIAGFKTRKGQVIGAKVTLRGEKMFHFFEKLVSIVLPRLRDFRGVSGNSFDKKGNYTIGFREINNFPEVEYSKSERAIGLEATICTNAKTTQEARALLAELGVPFTGRAQVKKKEIATVTNSG